MSELSDSRLVAAVLVVFDVDAADHVVARAGPTLSVIFRVAPEAELWLSFWLKELTGGWKEGKTKKNLNPEILVDLTEDYGVRHGFHELELICGLTCDAM